MARESTSQIQGVPSFEYNPADLLPKQTLLFQLSRPLDDLKKTLLRDFVGRSLTMVKIYEEHSVDRPYTKKNYKDVLLELEGQGKITASKHKKNTFADSTEVTFPESKVEK
jgi:hypothetical protein